MTRFPGYAGIETVTNIVVRRLHQLHPGLKIVIVAHLMQNVKQQELPSDIKIYYFPGAYGSADDCRWHDPVCKKMLFDILRKEDVDTIVYQDSYARTEKPVCRLARQLGIKLIVFEHNTPINYILAYKRGSLPLVKWLHYPFGLFRVIMRKRRLYRYCHRYVLLSRHFVDEFFSLTKISDRSKIAYINNPIVASEVCPVQKKENIILYVGRLTYMKRVDLMLKAWGRLSSKYPDWKFVCVGDGEERQNLERYISSNHIKNVEFCGYQQPESFYERSKIFWMMSVYEGWGMTLVEAMQRGCVPVAFNTFSSIKDIIDNGKNGYLVKDRDEEEFITRTSQLIENQILFRQMSESARNKVKDFEIDNIIKHWEELLELK